MTIAPGNLGRRRLSRLCVVLGLVAGLSQPWTASAQEGLRDVSYWAGLCELLLEQGDYEEAIAACDEAINIRRKRPQVWSDRADALFALGRYAEAVASYNQALDRGDSRNSRRLTRRCAAEIELGHYEPALDSCDRALAEDRDWGSQSPARAWYYRGLALEGSNQAALALEAYEQALSLTPDDWRISAQRCRLLSELGEAEAALTDCDRAVEHDGIYEENRVERARAWLIRGRLLRDRQRYDEALLAYDRALALNAENATIWTEQAILLGVLGRHQQAQGSFEWAIELAPESSFALAHQCANFNRLEDYEAARAACETALQDADNHWGDRGPAYAWMQLANALMGLEQYEEALAASNRAIGLDPDFADAWSNRSVPLWYLNRERQALAATERAIAIAPNSSLAWFNQGRILAGSGRYRDAVASYYRALRGDANVGDRPTLAEIWVNLSATFYRWERYDEAMTAAEQALAIEPDSALAFYNRGLALMALGRYAEAATTYEAAIALDSENADFWAGLGIALRLLGENPEALAALERALEINPDHTQALLNQEALTKAD